MRPSRIKYDPRKSLEQIAQDSNVSVDAVKQYIKSRHIDRKYDEQVLKYRRVQQCKKDYPSLSYVEIGEKLKMAPGTARKYGEMTSPPRLARGKISMVDEAPSLRFVSVSDSQDEILCTILRYHLGGATTFDCDLTVGQGGFYSRRVQFPRHLFDINPSATIQDVHPLSEARMMPGDFFASVVIDLPASVVRPRGRSKQSYASYDSLDDMYESYNEMILLAHRLLKKGGILVFKTSDFGLNGEKVWMSDWSIRTATEAGFSLVDKYIYIDHAAINVLSATAQRRHLTPTHAYFLVLKK